MINVKLVQSLLNCSEMTAGRALRRLEQAEILHQTSVGRRHRYWEAPDVFSLLNNWERQLVKPAAGVQPVRPVPRGS